MARSYTFQDHADRLGIHVDVFLLASISCSRLLNCGWDIIRPSRCATSVVKVWCAESDCSKSIPIDPNDLDNPCVHDTYRRECNDLARPITCEPLESRGLVYYMTDGAPPGGWLPNPLFSGRTPHPDEWPVRD